MRCYTRHTPSSSGAPINQQQHIFQEAAIRARCMADIANKDEAFKCLDIVREALRAGDHVKAEKFAAKALRLYRCDKVRDC